MQDRPVELLGKFDHGYRFVEVFLGKKRRCQSSERFLGGDEDLAGILAAAGNVEQSEEHARRTRPQEFVKVSRHAQPMIDGRDLSVAQGRHMGMQRVGEQGRRGTVEQAAGEAQRRKRQRTNQVGFNWYQSSRALVLVFFKQKTAYEIEGAVAAACFIGSLRRGLRE